MEKQNWEGVFPGFGTDGFREVPAPERVAQRPSPRGRKQKEVLGGKKKPADGTDMFQGKIYK